MKKWHVIYVNSRTEKKVTQVLQEEGWEVFCPLKTEVHQWSDRKKKITVPYFRSYVFIRCSYKEERFAILQTQGVVRFLFWLGQPALIKDEEMHAVQDFFTKHDKHNIKTLEMGEKYEITNGVFAGQVGIAVWQNTERVILDMPDMKMRFSVDKKVLLSLKNH